MKGFFQSLFVICIAGLLPVPAIACTDIRLPAKDGTIMVTRTLEYAMDLNSNLRTSNINRSFSMTAPDGKPGLSWQAKYGYVFLDALNQDVAVDGMNEKGLSFEALYLPDYAEYQTVPADQNKNALSHLHVGDWVLSNFATVDEVRTAIQNIYVYLEKLPALQDRVFPLHYAIHDASGKGIVIEYVKGQLHIYDNEIGVMTNSPSYDWHLTNLVNYLHLAPSNPSPVIDNGVKFAATGQGYGMIGLPGDISPPSRFVKMATLLKVAIPAETANEVLNLSEHIINNVDVLIGLAREKTSGNAINDFTQWTVFKDLTHKIFYFRTYRNLSLRSVSLENINFTESAARLKMPIASPNHIQDLTTTFQKST